MRSHVLRVPAEEPRGNCRICLQERIRRVAVFDEYAERSTVWLLERWYQGVSGDDRVGVTVRDVIWWLLVSRRQPVP